MLPKYLLKAPINKKNKDAEKFFIHTLETQKSRYKSDEISIYGVKKNSQYIDVDFDKSGVYVSNGYAEKYQKLLLKIFIIVVIGLLALKSTLKHFKGEGGCCGGGTSAIREKKKLDAPKIGKKIIFIDGMHCENYQNRVEHVINQLDGAARKVNLRKKSAVVSYSQSIPDSVLKETIENAGYTVKKIKEK